MTTNYQKLNPFEILSILVAVLGLGLILSEIFITLPQKQQLAVAQSFQIFDMRQEVSQVADTTQFVASTVNDFYAQFDMAFVQTFSFPEQVGKPIIQVAQSLDDYANTMAINYEINNAEPQQGAGEVLGAMITKMTKPDEPMVPNRRIITPVYHPSIY
jgi:hypothetical protein